MLLALTLALLIGVVLGALGSGGAIITLPVLVHVAGLPAYEAIPIALGVVGSNSAVASWLHIRQGNFHAKAILLFGATGIPGAYLGSGATRLVPGHALMLTLSVLMLLVAVSMLRRSELRPGARCRIVRCALLGLGVGLLTGFLGVGGGFLVVPALILFAGLEPKRAIGTSLAVIAINSGAGILGQLRYAKFDGQLALGFLAMMAAGMLAGVALAARLPDRTLRAGFAYLLFAMAGATGIANTLPLVKD